MQRNDNKIVILKDIYKHFYTMLYITFLLYMKLIRCDKFEATLRSFKLIKNN